MKTDLFQSCGHCWVFQICWHTECGTFTASSFRTWNSSTEIPSPPLALFVVILPKAHLTLHSRMSGSRWVITPSWLPGSWRSFLFSSSVYFCHLFLISSASVRSIPFLSFIVPIFVWNVPLISLIFLKRSLVFPILLFSSISLHWSLKKAFLSLLAILPVIHTEKAAPIWDITRLIAIRKGKWQKPRWLLKTLFNKTLCHFQTHFSNQHKTQGHAHCQQISQEGEWICGDDDKIYPSSYYKCFLTRMVEVEVLIFCYIPNIHLDRITDELKDVIERGIKRGSNVLCL